eukprot:XP_014043276.1 PREDICTED: uncharacterized protein LOC106596514 [Salmo salar]
MVLSISRGTSVEDIITPDRDVVDVMEGSSIKLSCRYNSSLTNSLLWYLQHPGSSPQFLIVDYSGIITNTDSTKWTLIHEKEKTRVDLDISSTEVTDSTLFYCALKPTIAGEHITHVKHEVISTEGKPVTLSCSYDACSEYLRLYWYKHYPNQAPQFLLYKGARSWRSEHITDKRYKSTTSWTSTELVITSLTLADTALYYCALRDDTQRYNVYKTLYKNLQIKMLC